MKVRQSTVEKIEETITFICKQLSGKKRKRKLLSKGTPEYARLNIRGFMRKSGYLLYKNGFWSLNTNMSQNPKIILEDVMVLYQKQQGATYAKSRSKITPVLSLSIVLTKISDEKLIEEVQRRGYIVLAP